VKYHCNVLDPKKRSAQTLNVLDLVIENARKMNVLGFPREELWWA